MPEIPTDLISPTAAASLLGTSRATVYRWIAGGRLHAWTVAGTRYRVSRAEVLALVRRTAMPVRTPPHRSAARRARTRELLGDLAGVTGPCMED
jgi:excisionase family DNA binding protein